MRISETTEGKVETDRGQTAFIVKDEDHVHRLGGGRRLIIDAYGTRYRIPDIYCRSGFQSQTVVGGISAELKNTARCAWIMN